MNAVVVLCHFCEEHGPTVVMCTQPYRLSENSSNGESGGPGEGAGAGQQPRGDPPANYIPFNKLVSGMAGPGIVPVLPSNYVCGGGPSVSTSQRGTCRACCFISREEAGLVSNDHPARTSYLSTQWPEEQTLYSAVRSACVRSLSCEVCPGREGPIYFGEDQGSHVLSYNFYIKDTMARGMQGKFSILFISRDQLHLLHAWAFLVTNIRRMVDRLQEAGERIFSGEQGQAQVSCPIGASASSMTRTSGLHPAAASRHVRSGTNAGRLRSLLDLTDDEQIFYKLHSWFTWLLRAGARCWTEHPLAGAPTEDQLIALEEREGGVGSEDFFLTESVWDHTGGVGDASAVDKYAAVRDLQHLYTLLGPDRFALVGQNVIVGNQVVVRAPTPRLGTALLAAFAKLLPRGCITQQANSPKYLPRFQCNLLSLPAGTPLPPDLNAHDADPLVVLDIDFIDPDTGEAGSGTRGTPSFAVAAAANEHQRPVSFTADKLTVRLWTNHGPAPCHNYNNANPLSASDTRLSTNHSGTGPNALPPAGTPTRATLLEHVMRLFSQRPPLPESTLELALEAARHDWVNKARLVFAFIRCQTPGMPEDEARRLLHSILAACQCSSPDDESVVRFWQRGLSQQFKQKVAAVGQTLKRSTSSAVVGGAGSNQATGSQHHHARHSHGGAAS